MGYWDVLYLVPRIPIGGPSTAPSAAVAESTQQEAGRRWTRVLSRDAGGSVKRLTPAM